MKKIFLIVLLIVLNTTTHAQTQVDTIGLLRQTILNKKSDFIGKPFSTIVNALPVSLPIKHYFPDWLNGLSNKRTMFGFIDIQNRRKDPKNIIYIYIYWQNKDSLSDEDEQWRKLPVGQWDQDDLHYYKDKIIKDVKVAVIGLGGYEVK